MLFLKLSASNVPALELNRLILEISIIIPIAYQSVFNCVSTFYQKFCSLYKDDHRDANFGFACSNISAF